MLPARSSMSMKKCGPSIDHREAYRDMSAEFVVYRDTPTNPNAKRPSPGKFV